MSTPPVPTPSGSPPNTWPTFDVNERRVLGVLVEKSKTTPDAYPMSVNGLVTGSNQKTNRDPILELDEGQIEETLLKLQKKGLVTRVISSSGRVERWKHNLYDLWKLGKIDLSLLAELLLRGPQTEGELRGRASRMDPIEDLEALRGLCKPLAERRLVVYLTPEGRRGTMLTHGFHASEELERLKARYAGQALDEEDPRPPVRPVPVDTRPDLTPRLDQAHAEIATLKGIVADLQEQIKVLQEHVRVIKEGLGL